VDLLHREQGHLIVDQANSQDHQTGNSLDKMHRDTETLDLDLWPADRRRMDGGGPVREPPNVSLASVSRDRLDLRRQRSGIHGSCWLDRRLSNGRLL
jgi:hypothetical protein